jgi:hypothetical protein
MSRTAVLPTGSGAFSSRRVITTDARSYYDDGLVLHVPEAEDRLTLPGRPFTRSTTPCVVVGDGGIQCLSGSTWQPQNAPGWSLQQQPLVTGVQNASLMAVASVNTQQAGNNAQVWVRLTGGAFSQVTIPIRGVEALQLDVWGDVVVGFVRDSNQVLTPFQIRAAGAVSVGAAVAAVADADLVLDGPIAYLLTAGPTFELRAWSAPQGVPPPSTPWLPVFSIDPPRGCNQAHPSLSISNEGLLLAWQRNCPNGLGPYEAVFGLLQ